MLGRGYERSGGKPTRFDSTSWTLSAMSACMPAMRRITHTCGHDQDHYIIGEYAADCDRRAAYLARRICDGCRKYAATQAACAERAAIVTLKLVPLQGSPKQVAWAETIRSKRLSALQRQDSHAALSIAGVADAKWWIDRRSEPDAVLIALGSTLTALSDAAERSPVRSAEDR